jgi:WD40 repeat protein
VGPDGKTLAAGDDNGFAYLWHVATRARVAALANSHDVYGVQSVAFSPDGKTLATADQNGRTYLWDIPRGARVRSPVAG